MGTPQISAILKLIIRRTVARGNEIESHLTVSAVNSAGGRLKAPENVA